MTRPAVTLWLVLAFHFFVRDALALCSNWSSTETCVADTSCEWRWNTRSCTSSCRVLYSSIADCVDDDACEWNAALQTCRQRCSWQTTEAVCFQPTCEWATIVGTPFSKCMSNCARYGAVSGDCSTDSNCMWNSTRCVDNPNATTTANSTYIMTIVNPDLVRILANNTAAISSFALALQDDLLTLTNRSGLILIDSSGFTVTMNDNVVTVEFLCQFTEPPSLIRTESSMGGTWLTATTRLFTALGGTSPLSVQSLQGVASVTTLAPQGFRPGATLNPDPGTSHLVVTPASSEPPLSPIQIILIVVGTLVLVVAGVGVSVWVWRRNPYAASRGPVRVERFGPEEYDRLRAANDHVVTYEQAMELKQKWDSLHGGLESVSEMSRWPVVARCDMPRKELRSAEMRGVADALTSVLFPVVFEHLTHIRIAMDENDAIRINTQNVDPIDVVRYNGAFRLQMNRNSASVVLLGASRLIVVSMNDDGSCRPYDSVQVLRPDAPDSCNVVKDLFETSNCCSHVGIIDQRKIVMARLIAADPFVVPTSSAPGNVDSAVTLLGVPESWISGVVETAVKVMVRAGSLHLIDGASKSIAQCQVRVQRGNDAGEWRVRVHPPQALSILIAVSSRFWCLDDDILCCQCTSGISILPAQGTDRAAIEDESQATAVAIEMTRIG